MESVKKLHLGDKAVPLIIAFVAVVIVGIFAIKAYKNRDIVQSQRTACLIYAEGPCTVMREGATLDCVADMPLYSGDTIYTGINASARIRLDGDKFLYLDATTRINLTVSGTPEESHTLVYVEAGNMITEVKETLADGSTFDIVTPNTNTSIHGTDVFTSVTSDENGKVYTNIAFLSGRGSFGVIQRDPNGNICMTVNVIGAGESIGVGSQPQCLLLPSDVKSVVENGKTSDGTIAQNTTIEDLGAELMNAQFSPEFLAHAQAVFAASHKEDQESGREGASSFDTDSNGLDDVIENVIRLLENGEKIPESVSSYYNMTVIYSDPAASGETNSETQNAAGDNQNPDDSTDTDTTGDAGAGDQNVGPTQNPAQPAGNDDLAQQLAELQRILDEQAAAEAAAQQAAQEAAQQQQNNQNNNNNNNNNNNSGGSGSPSQGPNNPSQVVTEDPPLTDDPGTSDIHPTDEPGSSDTTSTESPEPTGSGGGSSDDSASPPSDPDEPIIVDPQG